MRDLNSQTHGLARSIAKAPAGWTCCELCWWTPEARRSVHVQHFSACSGAGASKGRTVESRPCDECNGRRCDVPSSARSRTPVGAASQLVMSWPPGDNVLPTVHSHMWTSIRNPCINRSRFGNMDYRSAVFEAVLELLVVRRQLHRSKVVAGQGRRRRRRPRATQGSPSATAAAWCGEGINR